ncbi:hypothetical protein QYF36_024311 [Acer negundo]|nr:hypothetical protein QYF36_024311 [Acer negundo]
MDKISFYHLPCPTGPPRGTHSRHVAIGDKDSLSQEGWRARLELGTPRTGPFKDSFAKHENESQEEVRGWREAFTEASNLSGWDSAKTRSESELVRDIVEDVKRKLMGKRSRLWKPDEVIQTLKTNTGTETVEGISLFMNNLKDKAVSNVFEESLKGSGEPPIQFSIYLPGSEILEWFPYQSSGSSDLKIEMADFMTANGTEVMPCIYNQGILRLFHAINPGQGFYQKQQFFYIDRK